MLFPRGEKNAFPLESIKIIFSVTPVPWTCPTLPSFLSTSRVVPLVLPGQGDHSTCPALPLHCCTRSSETAAGTGGKKREFGKKVALAPTTHHQILWSSSDKNNHQGWFDRTLVCDPNYNCAPKKPQHENYSQTERSTSPQVSVSLSKSTKQLHTKSPIYSQPCNSSRFSTNWASAPPQCESKLWFAPLGGMERRVKVTAAFPRADVIPSPETPTGLSLPPSQQPHLPILINKKAHTAQSQTK